MAYVLPGEEVLTIQLIENLQRQEINPIDKANAILAFFRNRHGEMDLETVFSTLVTYDRDPERVEKLRCLSELFFAFADVEQLGQGQDLCPAPSAFPQYRDDTRLFKLPQHIHDHGQTRHTRAGLQQRTCEDRLIKQAVQKRNGVAGMGEVEDTFFQIIIQIYDLFRFL